MSKEITALRAAISYSRQLHEKPFCVYEVSLNGDSSDAILIQTGIGKVHAALASYYGINRYSPSLIVNIGVSGGLVEGMKVGDLCLASNFRYHDVWCGDDNEMGQIQGLPPYFPAASDANNIILQQAEQIHLKIYQGGLLCGDSFIPNANYLNELLTRYPQTIAVDMESTAIAQTAYLSGVPIISLRIVSDTPLTDEDHGAQYQSFWSEIEQYATSFMHSVQFMHTLKDYTN